MGARILDLAPDEYHVRPGFSSTIAKVLISKSAAHARAAIGKAPSKLLDRGAIIHRLVLGKGKAFEVVQHGDWRTKAAQAARDEARSKGLVPVLACEFEDYNVASEAIRVQLAERDIHLDGDSELAIEWDQDGVLCRGMLDHVWIDRGLILDLKITEDASPSSVERTSENLGYAIQYAAYTRALTELRPDLAGRTKFLFAFCEPNDPYAMNLCEPDGVFREIGERRWTRAVAEWRKCIETGVYPAYGTGINYLNSPSWALAREGYSGSDV